MSTFRFYSMAVVAEDFLQNAAEGEFTPYEILTEVDGNISTEKTTMSITGTDGAGTAYSFDVSFATTINATWLNVTGNNRATPPNLRSGQRVMLLTAANVDKFYWTTMGLDRERSTLEDVIWYYSNKQSRDDAELNENNAYMLRVSTEGKIIHVKTNKNDGEPFAYDVTIDTKSGSIVMTDDVGTTFSLVSKDKLIRAENNSGSYAELRNDTFTVNATKFIEMKAPDIKIHADNSLTEESTSHAIKNKTTTIDASSSVSVKTGTTNINSNVNITGNTVFSGSVTANSKKIDETHKHTSSSPGNPSSPVI